MQTPDGRVYRLGALSAWLLRRLNLVKSRFFAQPNLLADRRVVGEYFQEEIVPEAIGAELLTGGQRLQDHVGEGVVGRLGQVDGQDCGAPVRLDRMLVDALQRLARLPVRDTIKKSDKEEKK